MVFSMDKDGILNVIDTQKDGLAALLFNRKDVVSIGGWSSRFKRHFKETATCDETTGRLSGHNASGSGS